MQADLTAQTNIALHDEVPFETRQQVIEHVAATEQSRISETGQPESPLPTAQQRSVVETCGWFLLTSHGLRSLAPDDSQYHGHYGGDQPHRDGAYHQGTVWAWLLVQLR